MQLLTIALKPSRNADACDGDIGGTQVAERFIHSFSVFHVEAPGQFDKTNVEASDNLKHAHKWHSAKAVSGYRDSHLMHHLVEHRGNLIGGGAHRYGRWLPFFLGFILRDFLVGADWSMLSIVRGTWLCQ